MVEFRHREPNCALICRRLDLQRNTGSPGICQLLNFTVIYAANEFSSAVAEIDDDSYVYVITVSSTID